MVLFKMSFCNDGNIHFVVIQLNRELIQSVRLSNGVGVKDVEVGGWRQYSISTRVWISKSNPRWVYKAPASPITIHDRRSVGETGPCDYTDGAVLAYSPSTTSAALKVEATDAIDKRWWYMDFDRADERRRRANS